MERIIHTIWLGDVPGYLYENLAGWRRMNPSASIMLWTEEDVSEMVRKEGMRRIYEKLKDPLLKSDVMRIMVVYRHGGIYLDADTIVRGDVFEVLDHDKTNFGSHRVREHEAINNCMIAAPADHPVMKDILARQIAGTEAYDEPIAYSDDEYHGDMSVLAMARSVASMPDEVAFVRYPHFFDNYWTEHFDYRLEDGDQALIHHVGSKFIKGS